MITMVMVIQTKADDGGDEVCNLKFPDFTQLAGIWNIQSSYKSIKRIWGGAGINLGQCSPRI